MKNILKKLAEIANDFDKKRLHEEADMIDEILKSAEEWVQEPIYTATPPGFRDVFHQQPIGYRPQRQPSGPGSPGWKAQLERLKGVPSAHAKDQKIARLQKIYNRLWDALKARKLHVEQGFGPRLNENGILDANTKKVLKMQSIPRMKRILELESKKIGKREKGVNVGFISRSIRS
jgi:hypothetical protein